MTRKLLQKYFRHQMLQRLSGSAGQFQGIGLSMNDADRLDKAKWNGQNLLGYALMMTREKLSEG